MKVTQIIAPVIVLVSMVAVTQAQSQSPADIVKARQQGLKSLGAAFKVIRDELKGESPDAAKIRSAAADITRTAGAIGGWFPAGTGPESGLKTDAKAEIWTDAAGFVTARELFVREADKWTQLGRSGAPASWKEAAAALGQSCKGCHDKYRVKKE
jgi:cytochrome c556